MKPDVNPLGQATEYISNYSPELLFPIDRQQSRNELGITGVLPFSGVDLWTAYEISWLNLSGKPIVALGEFSIPCDSRFIIESKSFKLYLNSYNQTRFSSVDDVQQSLISDLSAVAGAIVDVALFPLSQEKTYESPLSNLSVVGGDCLDDIDVTIEHYHPQSELLEVDLSQLVTETLHSNLLKTNCPVTGQPDWASLVISYKGGKINHSKLLAYIVSFREHQDFHENCVEKIFCDLMTKCCPESLSVYARYTRRGGLDINPYRSTEKEYFPVSGRTIRQ